MVQMASSDPISSGSFLPPKSGWQEISRRYPEERECLASFLALESAEVLAGEKPANLISLANKTRSCGRNLYLLWKKHGADLLRESDLKVKVLEDRESSVLLLLYRQQALQAVLAQKSATVILGKSGYSDPGNLEKALKDLKSRLKGEGFPHEIGVFLGYPLKDVVGFLGWARLGFTCQGPWKIFGNPTESLRLAETYRECRCRMTLLLTSGCDPLECLRSAGAAAACGVETSGRAFFAPLH